MINDDFLKNVSHRLEFNVYTLIGLISFLSLLIIYVPATLWLGIFGTVLLIYLYHKQFEVLLTLILFLYSYAAYLIPDVEGSYHTYDFIIPIVLVIFFHTLYKTIKTYPLHNKKNIYHTFNLIFIFLGVLILGSVFTANFSEGQSIFKGLVYIRRLFFAIFFWLLFSKNINHQKFYFYVIILGWILVGLNWFHYMFIDHIQIFHFPIDRNRIGQYRNFGGYPIIIFVMFVYIHRFLKSKSIMHISCLSCIFLSSFYLSQNRVVSLALVLTFLVIYFVKSRKSIIEFCFVSLLICGFLLMFLFTLKLFENTFFFKLMQHTYTEISEFSGHFQIRLDAIKFYWPSIKRNILFGVGNVSNNFLSGSLAMGRSLGFYLSDIGWFGTLYNYGILGLLWILFYLWNLFKLSWKTDNYIAMSFVILAIFSSLTVDFVLNQSFFIYTVLMPHLIEEVHDHKI